MLCSECTHWTGKHHIFGWCKEMTKRIRQQGIPVHDYITVRRDADGTKCPGGKMRNTFTLKVVGSGKV